MRERFLFLSAMAVAMSGEVVVYASDAPNGDQRLWRLTFRYASNVYPPKSASKPGP